MKTNKQKILEYIQEKASEQETVSFTAQQLQEVFDIQRANISTALNQLCTEDYLVKSAGRPVRYTLKDNAVQEDDFSNIVGANGSLKNVVKLAKACMLYPEKNICAYISGERGSGKRYFVKKMYAYAKSRGLIHKEAPFMELDIREAKKMEDFSSYEDALKVHGGFMLISHCTADDEELVRQVQQKQDWDTVQSKLITVISRETTADFKEEYGEYAFRMHLPSLQERGFEERLQFIETFFKKESEKVHREIVINSELLRCLLLYTCEGNVKQLKEDITIGCANAFVREVSKEDPTLSVYLSDCNPYVRKGFLKYKDNRNVIEKLIPENYTYSYTSDTKSQKKETSRIQKQSIYDVIDEKIRELKERNIPEEDIMTIVSADIETDVSDHMSSNDKQYDRKALEKLISPEIAEFVEEALQEAGSTFARVYPASIFQSMCFQVYNLVHQSASKKRISNEKIAEVVEEYPQEYAFAARITSKISKQFKVDVSIDDTVLLTMYFSNTKIRNSQREKPAVLLIMHGKVASSIKDTIQGLYKTDTVYSYDLLLNQSMEEAYKNIKELCIRIGTNGILVFYDMGSLKKIMETIQIETSVYMRMIELPMTLLILDSIIKMDGGENLEDAYTSILNTGFGSFSKLKEEYKRYDITSKKYIITLCASGSGSARQIEQYITRHVDLKGVNVIPLAASDRKVMMDHINYYRSNGEILCVVGTYDPSLYDIPYISVARLFNTPLDKLDLVLSIDADTTESSLIDYEALYAYLAEQLEYMDIHKIKKVIHSCIKKMMKKTRKLDPDEEMGLFLHIACMINRIKSGGKLPANVHKDTVLSRNKRAYNDIRDILRELEEEADVTIQDDEIATILEILK